MVENGTELKNLNFYSMLADIMNLGFVCTSQFFQMIVEISALERHMAFRGLRTQ